MKKATLFFSYLLFMGLVAVGQPSPAVYKERMHLIYTNIYQHFYDSTTGLFYEKMNVAANEKPHSYLWPLCALIQAANEQEAMDTGAAYMRVVLKAINQYANANPPASAYQAYVTKEESDSRFYDDNQWIAIASLDAYNRTGQQPYFTTGKNIYRFMMTGFDTKAGGGLYWKEGDFTTKNTCSNGPAILVALQLYQATQQKNYLDTALVLYNWVNAHLQNKQGLYYDALKIPSLKIDSAIYTYNTGTMLQANVLLYNITGDKKYVQEAQRIAKAAQVYFYKNNRLPGNYWFNVVLLRGYITLYKVDKNKQQLQFFIDDAERIWKEEKDAGNLLGTDKRKTLIDQAAMLEMYARLEALGRE